MTHFDNCIFAAGLIVAISASASTTQAGLPSNGPELTGAPVVLEEAELVPGIGTCAPWECGVNGPDLTGAPAALKQTGEDEKMKNPSELELLTFNGPDLTGTPKLAEDTGDELSFIGIGDGNCQPWQCGVNGPELTGVQIRSHAGGPRIEDIQAVASENIRY